MTLPNRFNINSLHGFTLALAMAAIPSANAANPEVIEPSSKPKIIFVVADDMGYKAPP